MYDHGVNNAMGLKWGAVAYRLTGDPTYLAEIDKMLAMQDRYQGQPYGMFSADEVFGGRALNRGIELCAVVEQMYSLEVAFRVGAELPSAVSWLDRLETLAFNALPATISADMWQHQYLQQANEITACVTDPHVWQQDGPDSTLFGVEPNFGCCTANFNQVRRRPQRLSHCADSPCPSGGFPLVSPLVGSLWCPLWCPLWCVQLSATLTGLESPL